MILLKKLWSLVLGKVAKHLCTLPTHSIKKPTLQNRKRNSSNTVSVCTSTADDALEDENNDVDDHPATLTHVMTNLERQSVAFKLSLENVAAWDVESVQAAIDDALHVALDSNPHNVDEEDDGTLGRITWAGRDELHRLEREFLDNTLSRDTDDAGDYGCDMAVGDKSHTDIRMKEDETSDIVIPAAKICSEKGEECCDNVVPSVENLCNIPALDASDSRVS